MAVTPPTRGQQDWDDEMNNALQSLDAAAQSAAANASTAVSTANSARDIAQSVHTAVIGTADAATAGFINDPDSETATALSATIAASDGYTTPLIPRHKMNAATLSKFRTALAATLAGTTDTKILCLGDSTTNGFGGGTTATFLQDGSYPRFLADLLTDHTIPASYGMAVLPGNSSGSANDTRWTKPSDWEWRLSAAFGDDQYLGLGGKGAVLRATSSTGTASTAVFADPRMSADRFDVYVFVTDGTSTADYSIQATGGAAVTGNTSAAARGWRKVTVSAGSLATTNSVSITRTGGAGALYVAGVEPWASTGPKVIRVSNAGLSGSDSVGWTTDPYTTADWGSVGMIKAYQPHLTIIDLGINDAGQTTPTATATFLANLQKLATAARITGDVVFKTFIPTQTRAVKQAEYATELINSGETVLDLFAHFGTWDKMNALDYIPDTDPLHPNEAGYRAVARATAAGILSTPKSPSGAQTQANGDGVKFLDTDGTTVREVLEYDSNNRTRLYNDKNANVPEVRLYETGQGALVTAGTMRLQWNTSGVELRSHPLFMSTASAGPSLRFGVDTPEGTVTAFPGTLYLNNSGGVGVSAYLKETGSGNTGWVSLPSRLTATATLDFPSITAAGQQELTITVTGAAVGDSVILGPPAALEAGLQATGYVSAVNTVKVRLTNVTAAAIDPASAAWRATVLR